MAVGMMKRLGVAAKMAMGLYNASSMQAAFGMLSGITPGVIGATAKRNTRQQLEAYSDMPWLRAVSAKIGDAVAATQWQVFAVAEKPKTPGGKRRFIRDASIQRATSYAERKALMARRRDRGELVEIEQHVALDLLDGANHYLTGYANRKVTQIHLDLVGEAFWIKERNALGAPIGAWVVPPNWITALPTPKNPNFRFSFRGWNGFIPDTEILPFTDPDPANPYARGSGTAQSLSDELETDEFAARYARMFFLNGARPDLLVFPKTPPGQQQSAAKLRESDVERIEEDWLRKSQGFWKAFKPLFLTREVGIHEFSSDNFRGMQFIQLRQHERDVILQTFGFPPEILGILENSNRSTIDSADYFFSRWIVVPRLEFQRTVLQEKLMPEYDERLIVDYVSPVSEDKQHALEVMKAAPWTISMDEWRQAASLEPIADGKGRVYAVPINMEIVPEADVLSPPEPDPVPPALAVPAAVPAAPADPNAEPVAPKMLFERRRSIAPTERGEFIADLAVFRIAGDAEIVTRLTRALGEDLSDLPALVRLAARIEPRARRRFIDAIKNVARQIDMSALEAAVRGGRIPDVEAVMRVEVIQRELTRGLVDPLRAGYVVGARYAEETLANAGVTIDFNRVNARSLDYVRERTADLVTAVDVDTRAAIRSTIETSFERGVDVRETARTLRAIVGVTERQAESVLRFSGRLAEDGVDIDQVIARTERYAQAQLRYRANNIARTEIMTASNEGQEALWLEAERDGLIGDDPKKRWIVTDDDRLDPECEAMEDEMVPLRQAFRTGVMNPPLHPMCRCTIALEF